MRSYIQSFPEHISEALNIVKSIELNFNFSLIQNIVISGQGGSGIGALIAKNILQYQINIPVFINQNYNIPEFVDQNTLFIASSYSGQTEETIQALKHAIKKNSQIFCLCSGGEVLDIAKKNQLNYSLIPSGGVPRAMLCYSLVQLLYVLSHFDHKRKVKKELKSDLIDCKEYLLKDQNLIINKAGDIASNIINKMPFIYTFPEFEGVALRFKQQLNENAKRHAVYNIIPEMNHNEIVAWEKNNLCVFPIFLDGDTSKRNQSRLQININQISKKVDTYLRIKSNADSYLKQYFYFIHLVDWTSLILAEKLSVDPNTIDSIDYLKKELKK